MISVLLFVFLLQLTIYLINSIGKQHINDLLWYLFTLLPNTPSDSTGDLGKQRSEVARLQRELKATSAQDEFSKWAKLRRQHDKAKERYDRESQAQQSSRANFDRIASALRWIGTQGLQFGCNFWFGPSAMFWLPQGWVPWAVEWVLSFPRAPMGSVSVNVWAAACACVIGLVGEAVGGVWTLRKGSVKVPVQGGQKGKVVELDSIGKGGGGGSEKKEL